LDSVRDLDQRVNARARGGSPGDLSQCARDAPAPSDHPAHVLRVDVQPIDKAALGLEALHAHVVDVRNEGAREVRQGIADEVGIGWGVRCRRYFAGRFDAVACLCFCHIPVRFKRAVALALGCAP